MNSHAANQDPEIHLPKWVDLSAQSLLDAAPDAMLVVNRAGRIVVANVQAEQLFGYTREQLIGKSVEELIPPTVRGHHSDYREKFFADPRARPAGVGRELFALRANGSEIPVDISLGPFAIESETFALTAIRDATERRQMEELNRSQEVLRASEERLRSIADTAPVLIWKSDVDKLRIYVNKTWLDFTSRSIEAELGNGWTEGIHSEDLQKCLDVYTQSFDRREPWRMEYRLRRYDGEYRWILDHGVPRFHHDHSFAGYIGIGIDVTDRKLAEETLSSLSYRLIAAQEQERARIARELHDDFGQRLALLSAEIQRMKEIVPDSVVELQSRTDELKKQTSEIATDIQSLARQLHSSRLDYLGLIPAMQSFCTELSKNRKVEIDFTHECIPPTVAQEISLCLFRVMQEALHNAVKHSGVQQFEVKVQASPTEIYLTVRDSGLGFDPELARGAQGLGLISMRERVRLVKGTISIASRPHRGTEISVRVPLSAETETQQAKMAGA